MRISSSYCLAASTFATLGHAIVLPTTPIIQNENVYQSSAIEASEVALAAAAGKSHFRCMKNKFPKYGSGGRGRSKEYGDCRSKAKHLMSTFQEPQNATIVTKTYAEIVAEAGASTSPGNFSAQGVEWAIPAASTFKFAVTCGLKYIPKYFMDDKELESYTDRFCTKAVDSVIAGSANALFDNHVAGATKEGASLYKKNQWTNMAVEYLNLRIPNGAQTLPKQLCITAVRSLKDTCHLPLRYGFYDWQNVWSMQGGWVDILTGDSNLLGPGDKFDDWGRNIPVATVDVNIADNNA